MGRNGGGWAHYVGPGEVPAGDRVGDDGDGDGLAAAAAADDRHGVLVHPHRPVALRRLPRRRARLAARRGAPRRHAHDRHDRAVGAAGLDAVLPAVRPQPPRPGRRGAAAGDVAARTSSRSCRTAACASPSRTRTRRRTGRAASRCGGRTCSARRPRATSTSSSTCSARTTTCRRSRPRPTARPRDVAWRDERAPARQARPAAVAGLPDDQLDPAVRHRAARRDLVREARPEHHRHAPFVHAFNPGDRPALRDPHRLRRLPRDRAGGSASWPAPPRGAPRRRRRAAAARHAGRDRAARRPGAGLAQPGSRRPSRAGRCRTSSSSSATTRPSPTRWPASARWSSGWA